MFVVLPALNFIAVALLAELHGLMGYFPACLRLRPVEGARPLLVGWSITDQQTQRPKNQRTKLVNPHLGWGGGMVE